MLLVLLTPLVAYGAVRLAATGFNEWFVPSFIDSIPTSSEPDAPKAEVADSIPSQTAHQIGLWLAVAATAAGALSAFGPRRSTEAWAKGAAGERATGRALDGLPKGYVVRHDLVLPGTRANIDHVVIGPTGVYTIETKNYAKGITIKGGRATTGGRSAQPAVDQANRQAQAMSTALGVAVQPIVCVQGGGVEAGVFGKAVVEGVRFCSGPRLAKLLTSDPSALDPDQVAQLAALPLARKGSPRPGAPTTAPAPSTGPKPDRTDPSQPPTLQRPDLPPPTSGPDVAGSSAPENTSTCGCGAAQVLRHRKADGRPFWGCSTFPACRRTRPA